MSGFPIFIGLTTDAYTETQYTTDLTIPRRGQWYQDPANGKKWVFLENEGTASLAAQLAARATTTDKATFKCRTMSTTITDNELLFAGVRVTGATAVADDEYGWFQIGGSCTMTASSDTTTAELGVVASNQSAGQAEAAADSAAGIRGTFGTAETTTASADVVVSLFYNVYGL